MSARPLYFGPASAPRFGWLHAPDDGTARGAVVLCPPLGTEELGAHWVYQLLADDLARRGVLVLRFDYGATGDSAGELSELAGVETWIEDVEAAIALVRDAGAPTVSLLGLRLGATVAACAAARRDDVHALVLWDPCDGRSFLREQRALSLLSAGPTPARADGAVELMALLLPRPLAEDVHALAFPAPGSPLAEAVLVLERPERAGDRRLAATLAGQRVERLAAQGQRELVDVEPGAARAPRETMCQITAWIDRALGSGRVPLVLGGAREAEFDSGGARLCERAVVLEPEGICAIVTEPVTAPRLATSTAPTAVFLNAGLIHHVGPGRMWVNMARRLAAGGVRSVRFDLRGIGDSRGDGQAREAYPPGALADVATVLDRLVTPSPDQAYLIGLCSGASHAAEAAIVQQARGVCMINPAVFFDPAEAGGIPDRPSAHAAGPRVNPIVRWLRNNDAVVRLSKWGPVARVRHSEKLTSAVDSAYPLWHMLDRFGLYRSPVEILEHLAGRGSDVLLICGQWEARPFFRWNARTETLEDAGQLTFSVLEEGDHALFQDSCRRTTEDLVVAHLLGERTPPPSARRRRARRSAAPRHLQAGVSAGAGAGRAGERATLRDRIPELREQLPGLVAGQGLIGRFVYLVATQVVTVLLGLVYWMVVARLVPANQVGLASTAMFASSLIGALGVLGVTSLVLVVLGDLPAHEQRILVSTCVVVSAAVTGAIAFAVWGASGVMGPSFQRLGANPTDSLLFAFGTAIFTAATVLDAIAIGMRRGPVQLMRNIVYALLKVGLVAGAVLLGVRTTTGLLAAWNVAMIVSFPLVFKMLRLHHGTRRPKMAERLAMIRRFGILSLRHHVLNVAISAVGFFLPVIAAMFARPSDMAYFSMAQLVSGCALLLPFLLTMSLFVESSGDDELLRRNLRRTLPVGIACCLLVLAVLEPGGGLVLAVFGRAYVAHGLFPLRVLLLGGLPYVAKDHFVAVRRSQERLGEAARVGALSTLLEIAAAAAGGALAGLDGLCLAWLAATILEALYFAPRVLEATRARPVALARLSAAVAEPEGYLEGDLTA